MSGTENLWKPGIFKSSAMTQLPRPIIDLIIKSSWDARESKVPLKDGATTNGQSKNHKIITVEGECGRTDQATFVTELKMYDELVKLEGALDTDEDTRFEFFIYNQDDAQVSEFRKFKDCWCKTFDISIGDSQHFLFKYSLEVFAEDPVSYKTGPGL